MWNTQERYIHIFPVAVIMLNPPGRTPLYSYLLLANSCDEFIIICIFFVVQSVTLPPIIIVILTQYGYRI